MKGENHLLIEQDLYPGARINCDVFLQGSPLVGQQEVRRNKSKSQSTRSKVLRVHNNHEGIRSFLFASSGQDK